MTEPKRQKSRVVYNTETKGVRQRTIRRVVYNPYDSEEPKRGVWCRVVGNARCSFPRCPELLEDGAECLKIADGSVLCRTHGKAEEKRVEATGDVAPQRKSTKRRRTAKEDAPERSAP